MKQINYKLDDGLYLCKVEGLKYCNYAVLHHDKDGWWQYYKDYSEYPDVEGWFGLSSNIKVVDVIQKIEEQ